MNSDKPRAPEHVDVGPTVTVNKDGSRSVDLGKLLSDPKVREQIAELKKHGELGVTLTLSASRQQAREIVDTLQSLLDERKHLIDFNNMQDARVAELQAENERLREAIDGMDRAAGLLYAKIEKLEAVAEAANGCVYRNDEMSALCDALVAAGYGPAALEKE